MRLTLIQTGEVPEALRPRFGAYAPMFETMFAEAGEHFAQNTVRIAEGEPFPDAAGLDAILITGSAAGVYDNHLSWMEPLRAFIRAAYAAK
ncbi:MAG: type 1 glutamine amidotransferase, partial [Devosia nanyangense]|nr:type 1 glutamine amidotransferase [Devosia nanyangense]